MRSKSAVVARIVLGSVFVLFGLDGLFQVFPTPPMPEAARAVIETLVSYRLFYVVKAIEVGSGLLLLSNRFVTLALCLLAPVLFNIVWFDANLDVGSLPVGLVLAAVEGSLLWGRRDRLAPLFAVRS